jgi:hypothetical protein
MHSTCFGSSVVGFAGFALLVLAQAAYAAAPASDNADDPAYDAEAGGAWKGANPTPQENPPGTDNGGTGFGVWDFSGGFHFPTASPYGRLNHFIDGVDFPASTFNNLGSRAFGLTNHRTGIPGGRALAARPFATPLLVGETVSFNFDNSPEIFGPAVHTNSAGVILALIDAAGMEKLSVRYQSDFNNNEWAVFDDTGIDTNIPFDATSDGSSFSFTLTGADAGTLGFDGQSFPINPKLATPIASLRIEMFYHGTSADGSQELFFDDLAIIPEPASASVLLMAGALVIFRRR